MSKLTIKDKGKNLNNLIMKVLLIKSIEILKLTNSLDNLILHCKHLGQKIIITDQLQ